MAQDYMTGDHMPFAGPITPRDDRVLVATGMNKWGFSNAPAVVAVNIAGILNGDGRCPHLGAALVWNPAEENSNEVTISSSDDAIIESLFGAPSNWRAEKDRPPSGRSRMSVLSPNSTACTPFTLQ